WGQALAKKAVRFRCCLFCFPDLPLCSDLAANRHPPARPPLFPPSPTVRVSVNYPTPAIVTHSAVRPLPRWALWLLCAAYVIFGFVGRDPWRNSDVAAFGYMRELALGNTSWFTPTIAGMPPDIDGLLPYW